MSQDSLLTPLPDNPLEIFDSLDPSGPLFVMQLVSLINKYLMTDKQAKDLARAGVNLRAMLDGGPLRPDQVVLVRCVFIQWNDRLGANMFNLFIDLPN